MWGLALSENTAQPLISVIIPVYNEEENVRACYDALRDVFAHELGDCRYEFIFCDNASTDSSADILRQLAENDKNVRVIFNSRNFGAVKSAFNGLLHAKGDAIVVEFPADLQDPPELIVDFVRLWKAGYKVCYGIRAKREESSILSGIRKLFYRIIDRLVDFKLPHDVGHFQLIDRAVLNEMRKFDDYYPYTRGFIAYCGFKSVGVNYTWRKRHGGEKKSSVLNYLHQAINAVTSFSNVPLRVALILGFAFAAMSFMYVAVSIVWRLIFGSDAPPGIATIIIGMFFLSGIQLFVLGVLGEYLFAIHSIVRRKPLVVEVEKLNFDEEGK